MPPLGPPGPMGRGPMPPFGPRGPGHGGPRALIPGERARDFRGTMRRLIRYLGPYTWTILLVVALAVTSTVLSIIGPKILGRATTALFEGVMAQIAGTGGIDFAAIGRILRNVLFIYLASAALAYVQGWVMTGVAADITYRFRRDIAAKIHRLPLKYFDGTNYGEVLSRVTNDVDAISQTLSQSLTQIITSVITLVGVLGMMFTINWQMTLVALATLPLSMAGITAIVRRTQHYFRRQQDYLGHINGHVEEVYGGHPVVKAFSGEAKAVEKFDQYNDVLYDSAWKSQFFTGTIMPLMHFIGNLGYVAVAVLGGYLAVRNLITVGDIQAFIQYVRMFTQPITQVANISNILQQTAAAAERVFEFLSEAEEVPDTAEPVQLEKVEGRVEFRNVRFGYTPDRVVIKNFSARAEPGQRIAIVGPTGAGKTTLVKLLMRFYDVDDGAILVEGHDVRRFRREDLRRMFGMVLQDTWLFHGTILENIRYGREDATEEEVIAAARAARVDHFVRTLPEGYQTMLTEETTNISQGQRQLLTIARAFLANPPMLILDEATSSVDTRTEILVQEAMEQLMRGRTSFIIAHRLSTIRNADVILVVRDGDIVEQGTHEELLARGGFYAELYNSQFEGVEESVVGSRQSVVGSR